MRLPSGSAAFAWTSMVALFAVGQAGSTTLPPNTGNLVGEFPGLFSYIQPLSSNGGALSGFDSAPYDTVFAFSDIDQDYQSAFVSLNYVDYDLLKGYLLAADITNYYFDVSGPEDASIPLVVAGHYSTYFYGPPTFTISARVKIFPTTSGGVGSLSSGLCETTSGTGLCVEPATLTSQNTLSRFRTSFDITANTVYDYQTELVVDLDTTDIGQGHYGTIEGGADFLDPFIGIPKGFEIKNPAYELNSNGLSPALPEPGAWSLLLCGLGFVGAASRSKRRVATAQGTGGHSKPAEAWVCRRPAA
jgi:hypothetical protein